ncbi:MAG: acetyl-CoA carboxylase biotin carboxyl carrier protein [Verrucomicrobiota bacterium]
MDIKEIRSIVELMNEHGLTFLDLSHKDFHIKLKKGPDLDDLRGLVANLPMVASTTPATASGIVDITGAAPTATPSVPTAPLGTEITSPMVGTFYSKNSPDAPPLVNVGDAIAVGQTLCIIEAMKVMNEIKAECSGILSAVVAEDGSPVQFGDVLFRVR